MSLSSCGALRPGRRLLALPAILAATLLTGCAALEIEVDLHEDGSGVLTTAVSFERELIEQIAGDEASAEELLAEAGIDPDAFPEDVEYEVLDSEERVGVRLKIPFEAGDDVAAQIDRAFSVLGEDAGALAGPGGPFQSFRITRRADADGWEFEATTAASDAPDGVSALLTQGAVFVFRLTLLGELTAHDADRVDGNRLEWDLPLDGSTRTISAASEADDGVPLAAIAAVAFIALTLGGGLTYFILRSRSRAGALPEG